jgi:hypothetical protein
MCSTYTTFSPLALFANSGTDSLCHVYMPALVVSCLFTRRLETFQMCTARVPRTSIVYGENTDCTAKRHGNPVYAHSQTAMNIFNTAAILAE